ncbi:MAG: phosphoribosylaminoimidazolesuccinocarboxamide synthase [Bdellovibrionota bacterium]
MSKPERRLIYEGSVKNLWEVDSRSLEFEYTNAYSVFDWGRMPNELAYKGESLAALGAFFFTALGRAESWKKTSASEWFAPLEPSLREAIEERLVALKATGLRHHFLDRPAPNKLLVQRVAIPEPAVEKIAGQTLYHYRAGSFGASPEMASKLVPLEVVFRFGMPEGSSLIERLTPEYAQQMGFDSLPEVGSLFAMPVLEFFTKLEDTDRFLTWEQALNYSGLDFTQFKELVASSFCIAVWLAEFFQSKGLELWDGKVEWGLIDGKLALVDSIGPDELRLIDPKSGTQISKEFLRLFYRKTPWFQEVKEAKREANLDPKIDWKDRVRQRAGEPPLLTAAFSDAADVLYPSLALAVCGENPGLRGLPLNQALERIRRCLA